MWLQLIRMHLFVFFGNTISGCVMSVSNAGPKQVYCVMMSFITGAQGTREGLYRGIFSRCMMHDG